MTLVTVIVGIAVLVGLVGIVLPVLPGSLIIAVAVLVWAATAQEVAAWLVLGVVVALLAIGWSTTYVLTARRVAAAGVPRRTLVLAGLAGIIGFFVVPVVGLLLFFVAALYALEYHRLRDGTRAWASSWLAVRAAALGMLLELGCALLAAGTWLLAVIAGVGR